MNTAVASRGETVTSATPRGDVLAVDDDRHALRLIVRLLTARGYRVDTASTGDAALAAIEAHPPDVVLLDVQMPGINGFEVCRLIKQHPATRLTPVVLVTGLHAHEHRIAGIDAGADDFITKPFDAEELCARVRSLVRLKRYTDELESAESVILSLALTVEARDPATDGHCVRLADYATRLGAALGLDAENISALRRGGYLHDVGKIGIPDAILLKPGTLTRDEYRQMQQHTIIGDRLCGNLHSLALVRLIVRHHHERLDGSGYPDGLRGDAVPLLAQIVAVADEYDAMTTSRPYRAALTRERAWDELRGDARRGALNKELVDRFLSLVALPGAGVAPGM